MATIEVIDGDITRLEVDAIANAANTELRHGGGVAGAISRAGGPSMQSESDAKAPIQLGAKSLALVAFGTGVGGFPLAEAARIEVEAVRRHLDSASSLERIVFCVRGDEAAAAFEAALSDQR